MKADPYVTVAEWWEVTSRYLRERLDGENPEPSREISSVGREIAHWCEDHQVQGATDIEALVWAIFDRGYAPPTQERLAQLGDKAAIAVDRVFRKLNAGNSREDLKLFPKGEPDDLDVRDLAVRLQTERGNGKSDNEIAREFTRETVRNEVKAQRLLARIRYGRKRGKINL